MERHLSLQTLYGVLPSRTAEQSWSLWAMCREERERVKTEDGGVKEGMDGSVEKAKARDSEE